MSECHYCFMSEFLSFRNQSSDLQCESLDWFLYDRELCIKRVKHIQHINPFHATGFFIYPIYPLKTFLYIPPEIPPYFQGVQKENSSMKWVNMMFFCWLRTCSALLGRNLFTLTSSFLLPNNLLFRHVHSE